jgi:hypothetical protein
MRGGNSAIFTASNITVSLVLVYTHSIEIDGFTSYILMCSTCLILCLWYNICQAIICYFGTSMS